MDKADEKEIHAAAVVSSSEIAFFRENGAVKLKGLLDDKDVKILRQGIDFNIANPSSRAIVASLPTDPGRFFEDFYMFSEVPQYQHTACNTAIAAAGARLMGAKKSSVGGGEFSGSEMFDWDQPYYNVAGRMNVSLWIPVDPVPIENSLKFIAGSHATGQWYLPRTFLHGEAKWFPEGTLPDMPPIDDTAKVLQWALEPGDAVAFHFLTLHAAEGNSHLEHRRRAYSIRLLGDDMVHAPRTWKTSPHFPGLELDLDAGVAMDHAMFPVLWSKR